MNEKNEEPGGSQIVGHRIPINDWNRRITGSFRKFGIECHANAYGVIATDDSLAWLDIEIGNLLVIEPILRLLREGDLVLVKIDETEVFRQVTFRADIPYFRSDNALDRVLMAAGQNVVSGIVTAVIRHSGAGSPSVVFPSPPKRERPRLIPPKYDRCEALGSNRGWARAD